MALKPEDKSQLTLKAKPCIVTHRLERTPKAHIFRAFSPPTSNQTPVSPSCGFGQDKRVNMVTTTLFSRSTNYNNFECSRCINYKDLLKILTLNSSLNHFVRGALYFNSAQNDSITPITNFIKDDIYRIIESWEWK